MDKVCYWFVYNMVDIVLENNKTLDFVIHIPGIHLDKYHKCSCSCSCLKRSFLSGWIQSHRWVKTWLMGSRRTSAQSVSTSFKKSAEVSYRALRAMYGTDIQSEELEQVEIGSVIKCIWLLDSLKGGM